MTDVAAVEALYHRLLAGWNDNDAASFAGVFTDDGSMVGFDGSGVETRASISEHLEAIFADHQPATYVAIVREVREVAPDVCLLRSAVGMVPPGSDDIDPDLNAIQVLVAVAVDGSWRVAHLQSTPAAFDGRPDDVASLSAEVRTALR